MQTGSNSYTEKQEKREKSKKERYNRDTDTKKTRIINVPTGGQELPSAAHIRSMTVKRYLNGWIEYYSFSLLPSRRRRTALTIQLNAPCIFFAPSSVVVVVSTSPASKCEQSSATTSGDTCWGKSVRQPTTMNGVASR